MSVLGLGSELRVDPQALRFDSTDFTSQDGLENGGRRYHGFEDSKYALPNDSAEVKRLNLQHQIWQLSFSGRAVFAPLPHAVGRALDIGCGTGAWAIDFALAHPESKVHGIDLSSIQPTTVPPNCTFSNGDFTEPWSASDAHMYDYIHTRAIPIGVRSWDHLVEQALANLEPGGWVEFQEYHWPLGCDDGTMDLAPAFKSWNESVLEAAGKVGIKLSGVLDMPARLSEAGFTNVGRATMKWPLGPWAVGEREKGVGKLWAQDLIDALEGVSLRLFKVLGWDEEKIREHLREVEEDIRAQCMHGYIPIDIVWAQKPSNTAA